MPPSPPSHPMPLRRNIKPPKRFHDDLLDVTSPVISRGHADSEKMDDKFKATESSRVPTVRAFRPTRLSMAPNQTSSDDDGNHDEASQSMPPPRRARPRISREGEADLKELVNPRKSHVPKNTYTGPQTKFNPNLPPACFPTLDNPKYIQKNELAMNNAAAKRVSTDLENAPCSSGNVRKASSHLMHRPALSRSALSISNEARSNHISSMPSSHHDQHLEPRTHVSNHSHPFRPRPYVTPTSSRDDHVVGEGLFALQAMNLSMGPLTHSIGNTNQVCGKYPGEISKLVKPGTLDRSAAEMDTSDEDKMISKEQEKNQAPSRAQLWDSIPSALKIHAVDSVYEKFSDDNSDSIFRRLKLIHRQIVEITNLINARTKQVEQENAALALLQVKAREYLLNKHGRRLSNSTFQSMLDQTIYKNLETNNPVIGVRRDWRKAKCYLESCGLPGAILDDEGGPTELK